MYSVMNPKTRAYDYYETGESETWHSPPPPARRASSSLGSTPEDAAWTLPIGARRVGSGAEARGRVASIRAGGALGDISSSGAVIGLAAAGIALLAWKGSR